MEFFKQLAGISDGLDLTIRIKQKNGKLTISVLPDSIENIQPLITTGTPEQLDAEFFDAIRKPLNDAKTIVVNQAEFSKGIEDAKKDAETEKPVAANAKAAPKKSVAKEKHSVKKAAAPKEQPAKKTEAPKKEAPKQPEGPQQLSIV